MPLWHYSAANNSFFGRYFISSIHYEVMLKKKQIPIKTHWFESPSKQYTGFHFILIFTLNRKWNCRKMCRKSKKCEILYDFYCHFKVTLVIPLFHTFSISDSKVKSDRLLEIRTTIHNSHQKQDWNKWNCLKWKGIKKYFFANLLCSVRTRNQPTGDRT